MACKAGSLLLPFFIEDQGDVRARLSQLAVMGGQLCGDRAELDTVVDIARVDLMKQGNMEIGADQQTEPDTVCGGLVKFTLVLETPHTGWSNRRYRDQPDHEAGRSRS